LANFALNTKIKYWLEGILHSYSQIFFSLNKVFAVILVLVTFFSPPIGFSGFCAVLITNIFAHVIGFRKSEIQEGLFGFNALFLGMALGFDYQFNGTFALLFVVAMLMLLLITAVLKGVFTRSYLPFLSFPFLITYWIISLASSNLSQLHFDESSIYITNQIAKNQDTIFYQIVHSLDFVQMPNMVIIYFKTLAGTFFQSTILAGVFVALGLLYFSRIAFSLSVIGFASAYFFYSLFGADVNDLNYHLLGSNFIFLAIGIGCFYIIPNKYSYLTVFLLTPLLMILLIFLGKIMWVFQLKAFTLSFSVICTAFLFALHQRWFHKFLYLVTIQYYSAEKTIYKYMSSIKRFKDAHLAKISLPFWGEWVVSQGYNGKITHLGEWGNALDFEILDSQLKTYKGEGVSTEDYYSYNKPVIAPLDGYIYDIINNVEDNDIAQVNTEQNWGNTIVMNHLNGLFSQISHIKKDSMKVAIGEYVTKGTVVATCGNSGRSPEPHIHFQLQLLPTIGAKTLNYPISYFIERNNNRQELKISSIPKEGTFISNVQISSLLINSFSFYPGRKITFQKENSNLFITWEVFTDEWNRSYIYCSETKSYAYFINDGAMFYFTDFEGDKKSLLFNFYLAMYRTLLGYYADIDVSDSVPLIHFNSKWIQWIQDFVAPFYLFTKANYTSKFTYTDNINSPSVIRLSSSVEAKFVNYTFKKMNFELELKDEKIYRFTIYHSETNENYICD